MLERDRVPELEDAGDVHAPHQNYEWLNTKAYLIIMSFTTYKVDGGNFLLYLGHYSQQSDIGKQILISDVVQ